MHRALLATVCLVAPLSCRTPDTTPSRSHDGPDRPAPLATRWGLALDPEAPLPEYPRPTLVRRRWLNLNGTWQFEAAPGVQPPPLGRELEGEVLVPFPLESALSGVGEAPEHAWYKRTFKLPKGWRGDRVLLHFGAVDWEAEVWVNGAAFPVHRGGYEPFSFDVTDALLPMVPEQEIVVRVWDPTDAGEQPRGKQVSRPEGIWYSSVTGIWQTVWIEPVPRRGIDDVRIEPRPAEGGVAVTARGSDPLGEDVVEVEVLERGGLLAARRGPVGEKLWLPIPGPRSWSPDDPFLYDLRVTRTAPDGKIRDRVESYFGLRTITLEPDEEGTPRFHLNGEPLFAMGLLDQGWWPDGLYTAPSDDALRHDVALAKEMGFNLLRKHVKVEPERWYFWCDQLGMLVWQDMPNGENRTPGGREQFEAELAGMIASRRHHPSIVQWIVFNEGWGQYDGERLTERVQTLDPTRLVTCASGWNDTGAGHVLDVHHYPGPTRPEEADARAAVLGEYGGLALPVEGHMWKPRSWGYASVEDADGLAFGYELFQREIGRLREEGLCAAVYTQLSDVETECNGLVTYDRAVVKVDRERIARANRGNLPELTTVLPTSEHAGRPWEWRTDPPGEGWNATYGAALEPRVGSGWREGVGGFGSEGTPGSVVRTSWGTDEIWLRSEFRLGEPPPGELLVRLHHDEDVAVWVNGELVLEREGYTTGYHVARTRRPAAEVLRSGNNVIAVHCRQAEGGQYVDVGLEVLGEE